MAQSIYDADAMGRSPESDAGPANLAKALLDCLSKNCAILDGQGVIRITNRAWKIFGRAHKMKYPDGIGINYFEVTDSAVGPSSEKADEAARGIRSILMGQVEEFETEYPCHEHDTERWCRMRAVPLERFGSLRVVLCHEDITAERRASTVLPRLQRELKMQQGNLETVNTALNVLLRRREEDKTELEERVLANIRELVNPYVDKLKKTNLSAEQREYLAIIQANLQGVIAPYVHHLSSKFLNLTSREISVANLVLEGRGTKDIADVLCISSNAVEFHRKNIRKKLGIRNKKVNLRSRLLSLDPNCVYQQFHAWKASTDDANDE
jgi:DNA-binding CsgD family transcriptional regulator